MIKKDKSIKSNLFIMLFGMIFIPFIISLGINLHVKREASTTYVDEIKVPGGWGYELYYKNKKIIHQEFIAAIPGYYVFQDSIDASKAGQLALQRFLSTQRPTITIHDLDSLNVNYQQSIKSLNQSTGTD